MKKYCARCGTFHDFGYRCKPKDSRPKKNAVDKFRWTSAWQQKREHIKQRDNYLCQYCLMQDATTYEGTEVHHIVKLADDFDLRLDDKNLITLCVRHHKQADDGEIEREVLQEIVDRKYL